MPISPSSWMIGVLCGSSTRTAANAIAAGSRLVSCFGREVVASACSWLLHPKPLTSAGVVCDADSTFESKVSFLLLVKIMCWVRPVYLSDATVYINACPTES